MPFLFIFALLLGLPIVSHASPLPPIAIYANELNAQLDIEGIGHWTIEKRGNQLAFAQSNNIDDIPISLEKNRLSIETGWDGTGGGERNILHYVLLEEGSSPIVLLLNLHAHYWRHGMEYISDQKAAYEEAMESIKEELTTVGADLKFAEAIYQKKQLQSTIQYLYSDSPNIGLSVWKKEQNHWVDISTAVFPSNMTQQINKFFPFLTAHYQKASLDAYQPINGYQIKEKSYAKEVLLANKSNWKTWFGTENLSDLRGSFSIKIVDGKHIHLYYSQNPPIVWTWTKQQYQLSQLLPQTIWIDNSCPSLKFNRSEKHLFQGKIGDHASIKMRVKTSPKNKGLEIRGEYWYLSRPNSRFPIKGFIFKDPTQKTLFYRLKKDNKREAFTCFFSNCSFEGWWQHLESKKTEPFQLTLIN